MVGVRSYWGEDITFESIEIFYELVKMFGEEHQFLGVFEEKCAEDSSMGSDI